MVTNAELAQVRADLEAAEGELSRLVGAMRKHTYSPPHGHQGDPLACLYVVADMLGDGMGLRLATVKYESARTRLAAAVEERRQEHVRALEEAAEKRATESADREDRAEVLAKQSAGREAAAEDRAKNAEARAVEAEKREVKADHREHEANQRDRRAAKLGWVSLGATIVTALTVAYYTVLTRSMAESAERQVSMMAAQNAIDTRPYLALEGDINTAVKGVAMDDLTDFVRFTFHVINGGRTPVKWHVVEASFNGNPISMEHTEWVLFPGRTTDYRMEADFPPVKVSSLHNGRGRILFRYRRSEDGTFGKTYDYLREFELDMVNRHVNFTKEEGD